MFRNKEKLDMNFISKITSPFASYLLCSTIRKYIYLTFLWLFLSLMYTILNPSESFVKTQFPVLTLLSASLLFIVASKLIILIIHCNEITLKDGATLLLYAALLWSMISLASNTDGFAWKAIRCLNVSLTLKY